MAVLQYRLAKSEVDGKVQVLARFHNGKFIQRAKTHVFIPASSWNEQEEMPVMPRRANSSVADISAARQRLDAIREHVFARWLDDRYDLYDGWLQAVIDESVSLSNIRTEDHKTLRHVYKEYRDAKNIDLTTCRQYEVLIRALERMDKNRTWRVDKITVQDIDNFCAFFRCEKRNGKTIKRSQNTLTGKLKRWRALQNFAVLRGYAQTSPFSQFTIPTEVYGTPIFLTTEERNQLYAFVDLPPALKVQRDIFIFQCHVGCRVSDLISLTKDNVTEDGFLQYIPQKQRRRIPMTVRLPLSQVALEIIQRYADDSNERLLPFVHPNNYNEAIHQFMRLAGLDRIVIIPDKLTMRQVRKPLWEVTTSHTARKTFIEAMFRETKSERITSAFTGHAEGSRAFSRYTDVDDDMKRDIFARLDGTKK